jgi:hypothetical protein
MADTDTQDDTNDSTPDPNNPRDLRNQLDAANDRYAKLEEKFTNLQAEALMPTLNARQRRVVMRELTEDKLDLTSDNVKSVADDLGYVLTPTPPPATSTSTNGEGDNNPDPQKEEEIMVSLAEMGRIDRAEYNARRQNVNPDLETKMRNAGTREELRDIVRNEGPSSGIMHEWDDQ